MLASALVVLMLPVMIAIAVAILVVDGRPVLFRQTRVGRDGEPFRILKFRTMVPDASELLIDLLDRNERTGPLFKLRDDPRLTRTGDWLRRTSLDELPQLLNVIAGTMSLVGPRPALYEERAQFPPELAEREGLRPGITGLWQVTARLEPDFRKYGALDLIYVHSWSIRGDLWLLLKTPFVVARHSWASRPDVAVEHERAEVTVLDLTMTEPALDLREAAAVSVAPRQDHLV